jgi:hypothetical protein
MDDRLGREAPQGAKDPLRALDVGVQRVERRGEGGLRIALRREVKYVIRARRLDAILNCHRVSQVGIMKLNSAAGIDIVKMT